MISFQIPIMQNLTQPQKRVLFGLYQKIDKLFKYKKQLRKTQNEINSKMLINKQIIEQLKLRNEETHLYYKDRITELQDNVNKKVSLVKQFQKKFSEIDIFIQRECKNVENIEKWGHFQTFMITNFMDKNCNLLKLKYYFEIMIEQRAKKASDLIDENKNIPIQNPAYYYTFANDKIDNSNDEIHNLENLIDFQEKYKELFELFLERIIKKNYFKCPKEIIPSMAKVIRNDEERFETLPLNLNEPKHNEFDDETHFDESPDIDKIKYKDNQLTKKHNNNNEDIKEGWNISRIEDNHNSDIN